MSRLRSRITRRIHDREVQRHKHHPHRVQREKRRIQHLRALLDHLRRQPRVMFDDTSVGLIPAYARAIAGYIDGSYRNIAAIRLRFKGKKIVTIAVTSAGRANYLDIERGNATIEDAPGWWNENKDPGARGFYIAESEAEALVAHLKANGIHEHEYVLWTAHYDGSKHICGPHTCGLAVQAAGTQWTDRANNESLDESKLSRAFWRKLPHE